MSDHNTYQFFGNINNFFDDVRADQAFNFIKELLEGKRVRLEFDEQKKDIDQKTLAYVFLIKTNLFVNKEILRQGFAYLHISPPNTKYENELKKAYKEAAQEQRGLQNN